MKSKYLLLFLVFIYQASASFATEKYKFRTMSPDGGFYYDGIKAIEQDIEGFIWVMMDYELYRFDGYHYKKYYPYFASIAPTKRWIFNNIASDASGHLYVNTNNGLYRYKRISDRFEKIYDAVSQVKVDKADNVWIRSKNKWSILDSNTGEVNTPYYDEKFLFIVIQFSASTTRTYIHSFIGIFTVTIMRRVGLFSVSRSPIRAVVIFALPRRIWESYGYLLIKMDYIRLTCHLSRLKTIINLSLNMTTAHCEHFMWTRKGIFG